MTNIHDKASGSETNPSRAKSSWHRRRRVAHGLIFTAVYSRHMVAWLSFRQNLAAVIDAAWGWVGGLFRVSIPDNLSPVILTRTR